MNSPLVVMVAGLIGCGVLFVINSILAPFQWQVRMVQRWHARKAGL